MQKFELKFTLLSGSFPRLSLPFYRRLGDAVETNLSFTDQMVITAFSDVMEIGDIEQYRTPNFVLQIEKTEYNP